MVSIFKMQLIPFRLQSIKSVVKKIVVKAKTDVSCRDKQQRTPFHR